MVNEKRAAMTGHIPAGDAVTVRMNQLMIPNASCRKVPNTHA